MKNYLLLLAFFCVCTSIHGQFLNSTVGVKIFPGLASSGDYENLFDSSIEVLSGGLEYSHSINGSEKFYIQTGVNLIQRGVAVEIDDPFFGIREVSLEALNFSVPLTFLLRNYTGATVGAGLSYNRMFNVKYFIDDVEADHPRQDEFTGLIGVQVSLGYEFSVSEDILLDVEFNFNGHKNTQLFNYAIGFGLKRCFTIDNNVKYPKK